MNLFIKFMAFLLVLALVGPFILKGPDGKPLLSMTDIRLPSMSLPSLPDFSTTHTTPETNSGDAQPSTYYRWQDEHGVWHFSDRPNQHGQSTEGIVDPNRNLIPGQPANPANHTSTPKEPARSQDQTASGGISLSPTTIPISEIPALINQAQDIQRLVDERSRHMDQGH